jgi:hypothetical protein
MEPSTAFSPGSQTSMYYPMRKARTELMAWLRLCAVALAVISFAAGCNFVPKGATVFEFKSKTEFGRAYLSPENKDGLSHQRIDMRWFGTNKFLTTSTLTPGPYHFVARTYQGAFFSANVDVTADKNFYEMTQSALPASVVSQQASANAKLTANIGPIPPHSAAPRIEVLFIGKEIVTRDTSPNAAGQFTVEAPKGNGWRLEIFELGTPPRSYARENVNITGPVNLGKITLQ